MSTYVPPKKTEIENDLNSKNSLYDNLMMTIRDELLVNLKQNQIKTTNVEIRRKKLDSLWKKIIDHKIDSNFFDKVEDIAGVRVICTYYSDLERIGDIIRKQFILIREDHKTFENRVDTIGYQSDHYIVKLTDILGNKRDPMFEAEIMNLKCEIQVRTVLMHAWATVSHDVNYKQEIGLGKDYDREMYALSSLFFFADQRFDSYKKLRKESSQETGSEGELAINLNQEISIESLPKYIMERFNFRPKFDLIGCEELVRELLGLNYKTLKQVDDTVKKCIPALTQYEIDNPPGMPGSKFDGVGGLRICLAIGDKQNKNSAGFYVKNLHKYRKLIENESI